MVGKRGQWSVVLGVAFGLWACAGANTSDTGFTPGNEAGAGGEAGAAGAAGNAGAAGLADAWPSEDNGPAPTSAPTFEAPPATPPTCANKAGTKGDRTVTIAYKGLVRTALVHVPDAYNPGSGMPLVLNFHGFSSDALQQQVLSRMNKASDSYGFIAVHPYGVVNSWNAGQCCGTAWLDSIDDVGFVGALLDQLESEYCVDTRRVYSTGMSNGAFLSHRLGCEMSDRIAAIAPVAGVIGVPSCKPPRPVPVLHFHGTSDLLVPYQGGNPGVNAGLQGQLDFMSVAESSTRWREINQCTGEAETLYQQGDTTCLRWGSCAQGSEVIVCTSQGGGHTWPGGVPVPVLGKTSTDINATQAMIEFFSAHPMP